MRICRKSVFKICEFALLALLLFGSSCVLLLQSNSITAQTLRGRVADSYNDESLVGASVGVKEARLSLFVELDGYFVAKGLKPGTYTVTVSFVGYQNKVDKVVIGSERLKTISITLKPSSKELNELNVTAHRQNDARERQIEKTAPQLLNAISAHAIEISPDITVGNVLQRVSGVSLQRSSSGNGQYAIIRGLDSRYNYTSIDGIILPSPDVTQRSVPLDMFPADMVQRVEVVKSLTPDQEANAIGGATNMVMKDGPEHLSVTANLATGGSTVFLDRNFSGFSHKGISFKSPSEQYGSQDVAKIGDLHTSQLNFHNIKYPLNVVGSFTLGSRLLNQRLGYMFGGSYSREYLGGNTLYYAGQGANNNPPNSPAFVNVQKREYSFLQTRTGLHAKFNYVFSENHSIDLYGLFLQLDNDQHSHTTQTGLGGEGEVDYLDRVVFDRKRLAHVALSGVDKFSKSLVADWTVSYSNASTTTPDQVVLETYKTGVNSSTLYLSNFPSQWSHSNDIDKSAKLNIRYTLGDVFELSAGGLYRNKNREGYYNHYLESAGDKQVFTTINHAVFSFIPFPAAALGDTTNENNYTAHETVSAAYLEAKLLIGKLHVIAGIREETTDQGYTSKISPALPGKTGSFHYTDILPGLHLRYALTEKENLRLSYFAGISRPTLYDLIPSSNSTAVDALYTTSGNYNLRHAVAQNVDLRYDNFFSVTNYFLVGLFYKKIMNPIEVSTFTLNKSPITANNPNVLYGPTNPGSDATNYGLELVGSKFFGKFGLSANYSYTHSAVTTLKQIAYIDAGGFPVSRFGSKTRPLQGQADHIGNLSLLFKDVNSGFDAQLSLVYTGKRIALISPYLDLDTWQRANTQLDFSLNKRLSHRFSVFAKASNLLNNKQYQDILRQNTLINFPGGGLPGQTDPNRILVQRDDFRQNILLGLRYKL